MATSRFFRKVGIYAAGAAYLGGTTYAAVHTNQKRLEEFQKEHPATPVRLQYIHVPGVGGYWKPEVDNSAINAPPPRQSGLKR